MEKSCLSNVNLFFSLSVANHVAAASFSYKQSLLKNRKTLCSLRKEVILLVSISLFFLTF